MIGQLSISSEYSLSADATPSWIFRKVCEWTHFEYELDFSLATSVMDNNDHDDYDDDDYVDDDDDDADDDDVADDDVAIVVLLLVLLRVGERQVVLLLDELLLDLIRTAGVFDLISKPI